MSDLHMQGHTVGDLEFQICVPGDLSDDMHASQRCEMCSRAEIVDLGVCKPLKFEFWGCLQRGFESTQRSRETHRMLFRSKSFGL